MLNHQHFGKMWSENNLEDEPFLVKLHQLFIVKVRALTVRQNPRFFYFFVDLMPFSLLSFCGTLTLCNTAQEVKWRHWSVCATEAPFAVGRWCFVQGSSPQPHEQTQRAETCSTTAVHIYFTVTYRTERQRESMSNKQGESNNWSFCLKCDFQVLLYDGGGFHSQLMLA